MRLFEKYGKKYHKCSSSLPVQSELIPADDLCYEFEERAAIMEFDGGLTREEAEKAALRCIA